MMKNGQLSFEGRYYKYLDQELVKQLHVYKGKDYTNEIKIKHLLNQTSGLYDNFRPLLEKLLNDPNFYHEPTRDNYLGKNISNPSFSSRCVKVLTIPIQTIIY